jgi:hypothetical protein
MKWFDRTAQGFSPGDMQPEPRPERATDAREVLSGPRFLQRRRTHDSVALSGRIHEDACPRAEALGYSLRPFHGQKFQE